MDILVLDLGSALHETCLSSRAAVIWEHETAHGNFPARNTRLTCCLQKSNSIKLVSRWDDKVVDKWLSMSVQRGSFEHGKDSNRTSIRKVEYNRGTKINMSQLTAINPRKKEYEKITGPITIAFETVRGKVDQLDGT